MRLSIITPSFNQGDFIGQTFESVLQQKTEFPLEYILVDAVSTDATPQVVAQYQPRFAEARVDFVYICEPDRGQAEAINKGWRVATGDILCYLNSDDYYEPNVLDTVIRYFAEQPSVRWAYGGWNFVNRQGEIYATVQPTAFSKNKLLNYCNVGQPSCFFRREMLDECGNLNPDLHLAMDYDLWLRFTTHYPAGIIPLVISNMRYYPEAKSGARALDHMAEAYRLSTAYTSRLSWRRIMQYLYYLRGKLVIYLRWDITRRVERLKPVK